MRSGYKSASQNKSSDHKCRFWMGKAGSGAIHLEPYCYQGKVSVSFGGMPPNSPGICLQHGHTGCPRHTSDTLVISCEESPRTYTAVSPGPHIRRGGGTASSPLLRWAHSSEVPTPCVRTKQKLGFLAALPSTTVAQLGSA